MMPAGTRIDLLSLNVNINLFFKISFRTCFQTTRNVIYIGLILLQAAPGSYGDVPTARIADPPKQKIPIPEKYLHIQSAFENLRGKCVTASQSNPVCNTKFLTLL